MGVHVEGGFPNIGSVIGPAGNKFGEYILALKVLAGEKSSLATKVDIKSGKGISAPNFALVRVEPGALKESAVDTDMTGSASATSQSDEDSAEDASGSDSDDDSKETGLVEGTPESQLNELFGNPKGKAPKPGRRFTESAVFHFPESLVLKETGEPTAAPTAQDMIDATKKAVEHPDVHTTFFVGFPPTGLDAQGTKELKKTVDLVQSWQAWSSSVCEGKVQEQINNKALSADSDGQFARSTYRAKVFDYLFRGSTW